MGNVSKAMKRREAEQASESRPTGPDAAAKTGEGKSPSPGGAPAAAKGVPTPLRPAGAPVGRRNGYAPELCAYHDRGGRVAEEYRGLRTNLLAQAPDQRFCFVVTSAVGSEGKTVTCLNLALVMAERRDYRTIVIDCDFRRPTVAKLVRAEPQPGIAEVLRGEAALDEAIRPTTQPNLFIAPSGKVSREELGELVTRAELSEMMETLRSNYDYVLVDTPPINTVSETAMIGRVAGEALVVVRMNKTHQESVEKAVGLLRAANVDIAGMVLTHQKYYIPNYLYYYS